MKVHVKNYNECAGYVLMLNKCMKTKILEVIGCIDLKINVVIDRPGRNVVVIFVMMHVMERLKYLYMIVNNMFCSFAI